MNNINLESELNMNIDSMNQETLITNNVQARVSFAKEIGKKTIEDLTRKLSWEIPQNYYTLKYTKAIMLERNYGEFLITLNFDENKENIELENFIEQNKEEFIQELIKQYNVKTIFWTLEIINQQELIQVKEKIGLKNIKYNLIIELTQNVDFDDFKIRSFWKLGKLNIEKIVLPKLTINNIFKDQEELLTHYTDIFSINIPIFGIAVINLQSKMLKALVENVVKHLKDILITNEINKELVECENADEILTELNSPRKAKKLQIDCLSKIIELRLKKKEINMEEFEKNLSLEILKGLKALTEVKTQDSFLLHMIFDYFKSNNLLKRLCVAHVKYEFLFRHIPNLLGIKEEDFHNRYFLTAQVGKNILESCYKFMFSKKLMNINDIKELKIIIKDFPDEIRLLGLPIYEQLKDFFSPAINFISHQSYDYPNETVYWEAAQIIDLTEKEKLTIHNLLNAAITKENNNILPKFLPAPSWKDKKAVKNNYSGGLFINNDLLILPLLTPSEQHKHNLSLINESIIYAINKLQQSPFLINWEQVDWVYSSENPNYITQDQFDSIQAKKREEKRKRFSAAENKVIGNFIRQETSKNALDEVFSYIEFIKKEQIAKTKELFYEYNKTWNESIAVENIVLNNYLVYFPFMIDFRGRMYPVSKLSYTGDKAFRSCLSCGIEYKLNIEELLPVLYARFGDNDINLTNLTEQKIKSLISLAKEKELFKVAIETWKKYLENNIYTSIMIFQDATASSSQIQSLILGNGKHSSALNFVKNPAGKKGSIHNEIGDLFLLKLKAFAVSLDSKEYQKYIEAKKNGIKYFNLESFAKNTHEKSEEADTFEEFLIAFLGFGKVKEKVKPVMLSEKVVFREFLEELNKLGEKEIKHFMKKFIKFILMQSSYGGTMHGLIKEMDSLCRPYGLLKSKAMRISIVSNAFKFIYKETSQLAFLKFCNFIANEYKALNKPITFEHRSGALVETNYRNYAYKRFYKNVRILNHEKKVTFPSSITLPQGSKLDLKKQKQAFCANVTHAIDAAIAQQVINLGICGSYQIIHDSFGSSTTNAERIRTNVQQAFFNIFFKEVLPIRQNSSPFNNKFRQKPLLFNFLTFALIDLEKLGAHPETLKQLEIDFILTMQEIELREDYIPLNFETLINGVFVAPA